MVRPRSALVLGASAVLTYFFIGYENDEEEAEHFEKIAKIARECDKLNLPLIVEPIPTGPKLSSTNIIDLISLSVRMVIEAGADAIKAEGGCWCAGKALVRNALHQWVLHPCLVQRTVRV